MNRKALFAAIALGMTLSAPLAFAQDESAAYPEQEQAAQPADPATPATPADPAAQQPADPATPATPADPANNQITWADLDADSDGSLTKDEASSVAALAEVFDDADTDGDGALTPDEYKAFVAQNQSDAAAQPDSEG
jgi:hypothetical protein